MLNAHLGGIPAAMVNWRGYASLQAAQFEFASGQIPASTRNARDHALPLGASDEETVSCLWHALDENEREHPKTGKRDRDEETIGNEFFKCPHDPNPVV